jgi:exodeoxyribonuclease VII large subunit
MPLVPERIGLVTSVGSAAYNDFVRELEQGGFGHRVEVVDARVQGAEAETTLLAGLRTLARRGCEVVALVRGGGSQSDLAAFDGEALARAIARMPVPVITGIGHEIDTSVADLVAHHSFKTPTACAAFLVERTRDFATRMDAAWTGVAESAGARVREESHGLIVAAQRAASRARSHLHAGERQLAEASRRVGREAPRNLEAGERSLAEARRRIGRETPRYLEIARTRLLQRTQRLRTGLRMALVRQEMALKSHEERARALDPARVLARGYSLTLDAQGAVVRRASQLSQGQEIHTRLAMGSVRSRVESTQQEDERP